MERRIGFLILLLLIGCGGERPSATDSHKRTGRVVSSEISPSMPTSITPITVSITALAEENPTFQWTVNEVMQDITRPKLPTKYFSRGDTVFCIVLIEGKERRRIGPIIIGNGEPSIQSVWINPDEPMKGTDLSVEASVSDPDGDDVELLTTWYVNDEKKGIGNILSDNEFKAGDNVYAEVIPFDGQDRGLPKGTGWITIQNTPPEFLSELPNIRGRSMDYEIKTRDLDGDDVSLSLVKAPSGMRLDGNRLVWEAPELEKDSTFYIEIIARDDRGGETRTSFNLQLGRRVEE
ncbi:MAG: hypothetical protein E3J23_04240 [Candidatus Stahlbacteria bacterium]|nr:MAG: hypothetical protein E3J23_04240 [Candidatus Stahlbacteria bacterium]